MSETNFFQLVQAMTREPQDAKPGQFLDKLTGEGLDTLEVSEVAGVQEQRALWEDGDMTCKSDDGQVPHPDVEEPKSTACNKGCPFAKECKTNFLVTGTMDGDFPFGIRLSWGSNKAARKLQGLLARAKGSGPVGVTMVAKENTDRRGNKYFVVEARNVKMPVQTTPGTDAADDLPF